MFSEKLSPQRFGKWGELSGSNSLPVTSTGDIFLGLLGAAVFRPPKKAGDK